MNRILRACGLFGALLLACGCAKEKPEVPSWFKGESKKDAPAVGGKNTPERLQQDLQAKVKQLEQKQAALDKAMADVKKSRKGIAMKLQDLGVHGMEALNEPKFKNDEQVQRWKNALVKNLHEYAKYEQMRKEYSSALDEGKLALEQLDRQLQLAKAGFTEKELEEFAVTLRMIDERINSTEVANPANLLKGDELERALKDK